MVGSFLSRAIQVAKVEIKQIKQIDLRKVDLLIHTAGPRTRCTATLKSLYTTANRIPDIKMTFEACQIKWVMMG